MPGQSATKLARQCNVAVSTITRVARGEKQPSLDLMVKIRAATGGAVRADDHLPPFEEAMPVLEEAGPEAPARAA